MHISHLTSGKSEHTTMSDFLKANNKLKASCETHFQKKNFLTWILYTDLIHDLIDFFLL